MAYKDEVKKDYFKYCKTCGKIFYKKKTQTYKGWEEQKFCCLTCRRVVFKRPRKVEEKPKTKNCLNCGKEFEVAGNWQYEQRKYCSGACAALARDSKNMWDDDRRKRASKKLRERIENGTFINPIYMPGVIEKIKETKRKNKKPYSNRRLSLCSLHAADRIIQRSNETLGNFRYGKSGYHTSEKAGGTVRYRSSYELKAYKILDSDDTVYKYDPESIKIAYYYRGITLYYVPDIVVTFIDGTKLILEIKPEVVVYASKNIAKMEASIKYCRINNIEHGYMYWTEKELKEKGEGII